MPRKQKDTRGPAFHAEVQAAVYGYQINIMDIPKIHQIAEAAFDAGLNVTEAVHGLLDKIAVKTA